MNSLLIESKNDEPSRDFNLKLQTGDHNYCVELCMLEQAAVAVIKKIFFDIAKLATCTKKAEQTMKTRFLHFSKYRKL